MRGATDYNCLLERWKVHHIRVPGGESPGWERAETGKFPNSTKAMEFADPRSPAKQNACKKLLQEHHSQTDEGMTRKSGKKNLEKRKHYIGAKSRLFFFLYMITQLTVDRHL